MGQGSSLLSKEMQNILDQVSDIEDGFPFETTITMEMFDGKSPPNSPDPNSKIFAILRNVPILCLN